MCSVERPGFRVALAGLLLGAKLLLFFCQYFMTMIISLAAVAWVGQQVHNLLLTYLIGKSLKKHHMFNLAGKSDCGV